MVQDANNIDSVQSFATEKAGKQEEQKDQEALKYESQVGEKDCSDALQKCKEEVAAWKDKYIHVSADFNNFSARIVKERVQWSMNAKSEVLVGLLSIVDDFERALKECEKSEVATSSWVKGLQLIGKSLAKYLQECGVQEIETTGLFDPAKHEALTQVLSSDRESGMIVDVVQKGYLLKDTVLRPAKVTVAQ